MLSTEQLNYMAAVIDCEGSISLSRMITKNHPVKNRNSRSIGNPNPGVTERIVLVVAVGMTDRAIPEWLCSEFGGRLNHRSFPGTNYQDRWDWMASSQIASKFLKVIQPYLKLKNIQARLAIEFQDARKPHVPKSLVQMQADEILFQSMKELNSRGKDAMFKVTAITV